MDKGAICKEYFYRAFKRNLKKSCALTPKLFRKNSLKVDPAVNSQLLYEHNIIQIGHFLA